MTAQNAIASLVEYLLASPEPCIRWRTLSDVLGRPSEDPDVAVARAAIPCSDRARRLLSERAPDGTIAAHPYRAKWYGAHWVLVALAELGYPPGDDSLVPLREQAVGWVLSEEYAARHIGRRHGLTLMHASIDANVVWALLKLGLADDRIDQLVARMIGAQWPDGGWNCDRKSTGHTASFTESLIPLRALAEHARVTGSSQSRAAAGRAAEFFLQRRLFRRRSDGAVIRPSFTQLHFPCYWHYDVLFALTVLAEAGWNSDPRCAEALHLLAAKRLPDGGFPADARYYRLTATPTSGRSLVDWGPTSPRRRNDWVTVAALAVLTFRDGRSRRSDSTVELRDDELTERLTGAVVPRGAKGAPGSQPPRRETMRTARLPADGLQHRQSLPADHAAP